MAIDVNEFVALARKFAEIDLFGTAPPAPPWGAKQTRQRVLAAINSGRNQLPLLYQDAYVKALETNLQSLLAEGSMEPWAAPVYEHAPGSSVRAELGRFLAVVSNLYRSFLDKAKREGLQLPAPRLMPPLAACRT
jgi:hypothetical protein